MRKTNLGHGGAMLRSGVSLVTLAALCVAGPAVAQSADEAAAEGSETIVVTGVRRALESAIDIKRNAGTFVDSITATDIGAFPDKSAAEALQRVPGITVNRLQSADDSTHPSGEPTNVLIRGLTQVRTEFNGRDSFSADSNRGLNFNDVSPELLARVDAYKNQTAEMIEGGIAGTVDLRTRLPFDQDGRTFVLSLTQNYGDRSEETTPEYSALLSDSFDTSVGRFGYLLSHANSHVITQTDTVVMDKMATYCSAGYGTPAAAIVNPDGSIPCTANAFGGDDWAFAPDGIRYSMVDYDRHRTGTAIAAQYENNEGTLAVTLQYTDSYYENAWLENASHATLDGIYFGTPAFNPRSGTIVRAQDGTPPLVFGANGMLQSGILTQAHGSWFGTFSPDISNSINAGSAVPGLPFVNNCVVSVCTESTDGLYFINEARNFAHEEGTRDYSMHVRWDVSDQIQADFDVQYIDASTFNNDILVANESMANYNYSVNGDGTPQIALEPGSNINYAPGGLSNPHNYWMQFIQAHVEDNEATEIAVRGDMSYRFADSTWFDSLKLGLRYADREQVVRYSTFNWTPIAASWNCNGPGFNIDNTSPAPYPTTGDCAGNTGRPNFKGYGEGIWGTENFNGFYGGGAYANGDLVFLNRQTLTNFPRLVASLSGNNTNSPLAPGWEPICDRPGTVDNGCFLANELLDVQEVTQAAYAMLNFGGDGVTYGGVEIIGNFGLRVIQTEISSEGSVGFPTSQNLTNLVPCDTPLGPNTVVNPSCYLTQDILDFASGGGDEDTFSSTETKVLPSFNVRFGLDDQNYIRFAYSRAIARPDFGLLRNFVSINSPTINTGPDSPFVVYNSPTAAHIPENVTGYNFVFNANAGNASLKPIQADQFDLSYERYMGESSSFTVSLFYKELSDTLAFAQFDREFTNNGSTQTVRVQGPFNQEDGGTLKGFEIAYQTFFDFLPGIWSGLGMQVNYTHVDQEGINNTNLFTATSGGSTGAFGAGVNAVLQPTIDSHRLAGISDETYNIVGLYEHGPLALRLAYNWRSQYLTQNLDCCIGLPVFANDAGFLDGSIRYSLTDHVELSLQASNLLNTTSEYSQQVFGDSPATPGAAPVLLNSGWSRIDRRYQFGLRFKF